MLCFCGRFLQHLYVLRFFSILSKRFHIKTCAAVFIYVWLIWNNCRFENSLIFFFIKFQSFFLQKLKTKYASDPLSYKILQRVLDQEINSCTTRVRNSATDALMWLKRGLRFMQKFLVIFKDGERDLTLALSKFNIFVMCSPYRI